MIELVGEHPDEAEARAIEEAGEGGRLVIVVKCVGQEGIGIAI